MLDNLVVGTSSSATSNSAVAIALQSESIFANRTPPDIFDRAGAQAVDTFVLVFANNDIAQGGTVLEEEYGVRIGTFDLTVAGYASTIGLVATVEATRDSFGFAVGDAALGGGDREAGAAGVTATVGPEASCAGEGEGRS